MAKFYTIMFLSLNELIYQNNFLIFFFKYWLYFNQGFLKIDFFINYVLINFSITLIAVFNKDIIFIKSNKY